METTSQPTHATTIDWQEEVYQKIKALKDLHFDKLNDLYQKVTLKYQQQEALGQTQMRSELFDKLRKWRIVLNTILKYLTIPKNGITRCFEDKIDTFERQILYILILFRVRKPTQNQQGQQQLPPPSGVQSLSVQQQQLLPPQSGGQSLSLQQLQHNESHPNQLQSVSLQNSVNSVQSSTMATMLHGSMPPDYLRKISLKLLTMVETSRMNPLASNSATSVQNSQDPGQDDQQQNISVSQAQNVARAFENISPPQQHQKQPKKQKWSGSHAMGKGKKCRMSCAVEEEILCSICLEPVMDNGDRSIAKLQCSHQFHLDCIGSAFNAKASMQCPTCRRVENGQWRFADKYHAFSDSDEDDWAFSDTGENGQSGDDSHDD